MDHIKPNENEIISRALLVSIRTDEMPEEFPILSNHYFTSNGEPADSAMEDISFEIRAANDAHYYYAHGDQTRILYNGKPADSYVSTGNLGQGIRKMKEGDVISILNEEKQVAKVLVFHNRAWKHITWTSVSLKDTSDILYISRHEEEIDTPEIQTPDDPLPRHYAILRHYSNGWIVEDHSTVFGIFVNNCHIKEAYKLHNMDVIRIGHTLFLYSGDKLIFNHMDYGHNQLCIDIKSRTAGSFFSKKVLLKNVSMEVNVGEMVLILGGSGAGKTTFINAVMGYEKADGVIKSGDLDVYKDYQKVKYDIGFVPQQDLLRLEDSVFETLENAAEMRMPKNTTAMERNARINEILELLGLESERDNLVGKLSGGQRKRLSIAIEYIAKPSLFFLDEPDSGLDGIMARHLMELLRSIADQDKIVMVITHAPDRAADLFDKVIVLAKSSDKTGHLAFYGSIDECFEFFETETLEGVVKRINRLDEGGEGLADHYIAKFDEMRSRSGS